MSENVAVAAEGQVEGKQRAKGVSLQDFVTTHVAGCKEGKTVSEIAESLGMNKASYTSRASQIRAAFRKAGRVFPKAKGERTSKAEGLMDKLAADLGLAVIPDESETVSNESEAPATETAQS